MRIRSRRWRWVAIHASLVGGLTVAFTALSVVGSGEDANIGLGLVGLPLLALGLPWTLPQFVNPAVYDDLPAALRLLLTLGPAALNVGVHALIVARVRPANRTPA